MHSIPFSFASDHIFPIFEWNRNTIVTNQLYVKISKHHYDELLRHWRHHKTAETKPSHHSEPPDKSDAVVYSRWISSKLSWNFNRFDFGQAQCQPRWLELRSGLEFRLVWTLFLSVLVGAEQNFWVVTWPRHADAMAIGKLRSVMDQSGHAYIRVYIWFFAENITVIVPAADIGELCVYQRVELSQWLSGSVVEWSRDFVHAHAHSHCATF